jgi:hypothetical protein
MFLSFAPVTGSWDCAGDSLFAPLNATTVCKRSVEGEDSSQDLAFLRLLLPMQYVLDDIRDPQLVRDCRLAAEEVRSILYPRGCSDRGRLVLSVYEGHVLFNGKWCRRQHIGNRSETRFCPLKRCSASLAARDGSRRCSRLGLPHLTTTSWHATPCTGDQLMCALAGSRLHTFPRQPYQIIAQTMLLSPLLHLCSRLMCWTHLISSCRIRKIGWRWCLIQQISSFLSRLG